MNDRIYTMNDNAMCGELFEDSVKNVIAIINETLGTNLFFGRDANAIDSLCERLGIRFNEEGEIVK